MRGWKYREAKRKWKLLESIIRKSMFQSWKNRTRIMLDTRLFCRRKVVAWRYYTKRAIIRRETFRLCNWPFYIWRRYTSESSLPLHAMLCYCTSCNLQSSFFSTISRIMYITVVINYSCLLFYSIT